MSGPSIAEVEPPSGAVAAGGWGTSRAGFGPTLVLTASLALACLLVAIAVALLVIHPNFFNLRAFAGVVNQQNQGAKTALYVGAFVVVLPLSLIAVPRLADAIAAGPNGVALPACSALVAATLAATVIAIRVSAHLPWGDGVGVVLAAVGTWSVLAAAFLAGAAARRPLWPLLRVARHAGRLNMLAALLLFGVVLCVTHLRALSVVPLALGAVTLPFLLRAQDRVRLPRLPRPLAIAIDVAVVVLLLMAVPDTVIFRTSAAIPNAFLEPGIIQFQQDWILGPANQLVHGGALMVTDPVSQYGVGLVYFLAGWFHLAPIGYGTFGFLDGALTALFYVGAYLVLRIARVPRLLAAATLGMAVFALIYDLRYPVGALPEQGPLRFGLPMALLLALLAGARVRRGAGLARTAAFAVLGISAVWALEGFAYTALTFLAVVALEAACLRPAGSRRRFLAVQLGLGLAACVCAQLTLALATLMISGQLPHWGQYLAYLRSLLLGGREGSITYGFEHWSPGLAIGAACLVSSAAVVLLVLRRPESVRREPVRMIGIAGTTAYAIALFSYVENRSSTYLLLYVALPVVMMAALWLDLLLHSRLEIPAALRRGALAFCLGVVVLLIAGAWSPAGPRFSRSALAHAYPGGGLRAAIHRLWHPPPIDPRATEGARLVARYLPGQRVIVVLPSAQDLSIELLMRSRRANGLFIGDGYMDSFVPSAWMPVLRRQIASLRAGQRLLIDRSAQQILATLQAHPRLDPIRTPLAAGAAQEEWILRELGARFALRTLYRGRNGLVVAELRPRRVTS